MARMFACGAPTDCLQMRQVAANVCVGHASPSACDESFSTCTSNASFCAGCDAGAGVYLTDNACHNSAALVGKCRVFATDGGCHVCNDGYYIHEKTCLACMDECATCLNAESCATCNSEHFMTGTGECKAKNEVMGCAVEVDSALGCTRCEDGFFLNSRECSECGETFDACATCDATRCLT